MSLDIIVPQLSIAVAEIDYDEKQVMDVMLLEVTTATTQYSFRLCDRSDFRNVADKLAENIRRVGATMREPHIKLITGMKGLPDGLRKG